MRSGPFLLVDDPAFVHIMFMSRTRVNTDEAKA